jgi:signal transduction histidine kinase
MRQLPLFAGLGEADLERLYQLSRLLTVAQGAYLIREGEAGDELYIIIDGELEIIKGQGASAQTLAVRTVGEVVGEMAILEQSPRSASARALKPSRLLVIDRTALMTLLACSPDTTLTILRTVVTRLRSTEALLMQQEKLAALGTMAAGLAHELNNPAAAIRRSAAQLQSALMAWEGASAELRTLEPEQVRALAALRAAMATPTPSLDPLARSELEEALEAYLERRGVARAWELSSPLVASGLSLEALEPALTGFAPEKTALAARWLAASASVFALLHETRISAEAISALVQAVKSHAYLDQAPLQDVDVHESLESALVILRHKLQGIEVVRDYARELPRITAYGSELGQVWTNLIDNAIGAMQGQGRLSLRTYRRDEQVVVEIADTGPGIPLELHHRIFEPFFTTKPVGVGTGLGLHIAYTIVVRRHRGQLHLVSKPGFTCFQVVLPMDVQPEGR